MPVTLLFNDNGWEVATSAWSVAAKPGNTIQICYPWGADGISFFQSATGIARVGVDMSMARFLKMLHSDTVVDLRSFQ